LGDISVLIFYVLVVTLETFFLHALQFDWVYLLPAASSGLLAVAVLNVNNIRDIPSDTKAGKKSIPVRLGREKARVYHWVLLITAIACCLIYVGVQFQSFFQLIFLITLPFLFKNGKAISTLEKPSELDPYLKQMALTTLLFVLTFGVGQLL